MTVGRTRPGTGDGMPDVLDTGAAGTLVIRGGASRVGGYALGVALSIGSAAVLFRHLGVSDTGRYVTVLTLVALAAALTDCGLAAIGTREAANRPGRAQAELVEELLGLRLLLSLGGAACATVFAAIAGYGPSLVFGTALAGIGVVIVAGQGVLAIPLTTSLRFGLLTWVDLVRQTASVVLILALVAAGAAGVLPFLAVPVVTSSLAFVLTAWLVRSDVSPRPSWSVRQWNALLRGFLPYALAAVVTALYFRVALLITSLVANEHETGLFSAAYRVVDVLIVVPVLAVSSALPILARAARHDLERLAYAVGRIFDTCVVLGGGLAVSLVLGAPLAIRIVGGQEFDGAVLALRIGAIGLACAFAGAVLGYTLLAMHLYRPLLVICTLALGLASVLTLILASRYGAEGAATAGAAAELLVFAGGYGVLALGHRAVAPSLAALIRVLPAVGVALLALLIAPTVGDVAATTAGVAVYTGIVLAFGLLPAELRESLRRSGVDPSNS